MQNNDHPAAQQQQQQPSISAFVHRVYIILMLLSLNISQTIENHHGLERVCLCARARRTRNEENRIEIWFLFKFRLDRSFVRFAFIY